jgi:hypothetical protein
MKWNKNRESKKDSSERQWSKLERKSELRRTTVKQENSKKNNEVKEP